MSTVMVNINLHRASQVLAFLFVQYCYIHKPKDAEILVKALDVAVVRL